MLTGDKGYYVPTGGMFKYVTAANYFGELLEWCGFAIATCSVFGLGFAFNTACNLGPRALDHHHWYIARFKDKYPRQRKALIPFLW